MSRLTSVIVYGGGTEGAKRNGAADGYGVVCLTFHVGPGIQKLIAIPVGFVVTREWLKAQFSTFFTEAAEMLVTDEIAATYVLGDADDDEDEEDFAFDPTCN